MKLEMSRQIFSSITFRKILSPNSSVVPCGQDGKRVDGWTEHSEAVTFHNLRTHLIKNEHGALAKHWHEKTTALREIPVTVPLSPLQIPCRILENHKTSRL